MTATHSNIPDLTLETLSRSLCREAKSYGFMQIDYVKFVNLLLDASMQNGFGTGRYGAPSEPDQSAGTIDAATLPLQGAHVAIRQFDAEHDLPLFDPGWQTPPEGTFCFLARLPSGSTSARSSTAKPLF
jgi:hypothetical protein